MIYLASSLDFESISGLTEIELKPSDVVWVLPVCCMECDASDYMGWKKLFSDNTSQQRKSIDELLTGLGALKQNIHYFNYYEKTAPEGIKNSDCLILPGGLMELGIERLRNFGLDKIINNYTGKIIANSSGALLLFERYIVSPNRHYSQFSVRNGIGAIKSNLFLEVHYKAEDKNQQFSINKVLKEESFSVYALEDGGALVLNNNEVIETRKCRQFFYDRSICSMSFKINSKRISVL